LEGSGWGKSEAGTRELPVFGGYEAGYARAKSDVLASLILRTEEFLRDRVGGNAVDRAALRQFAYQFEEELEKAITELRPTTYVEGGLGI
jgi:hypothetical protein